MTSTAVQNLVEIRPWWASGQIGEILTIFRFLFIPLFYATHLKVRPLTTFSRLMAQMTRTHARMCLFLASVDTAAHLGDQIAQKPQFLGRE